MSAVGTTDTKLTVMYVPPMSGSATCVWNAVMPTNWTVLLGQSLWFKRSLPTLSTTS